MTTLTIEIDIAHARHAVIAALKPAIDAELASVDLQKLIIDHLTAKTSDFGAFGSPWQPASMLDRLICAAIADVAKSFVDRNIKEQRIFLEDAFKKMLRNSEQRLTRAFAKSMIDAVDGAGWSFNLDMKVTADGSPSEDDDD
jgi:hypothetical protein